eukprot:14929430-Alexandrium_andersonii.AAC.1
MRRRFPRPSRTARPARPRTAPRETANAYEQNDSYGPVGTAELADYGARLGFRAHPDCGGAPDWIAARAWIASPAWGPSA